MEIHTSGDKIMEKIIETNNPSSTLSTITSSIQEPDISVHTGKL
jgi:hypothetical protein